MEGSEGIGTQNVAKTVGVFGLINEVEDLGTGHAQRIKAIVPGQHRRRRNEPAKGYAVALPFPLIIDEEERLVFLDCPTQSRAKLIKIELFLLHREKAFRIERGIAEELEH